MTSRHQERPRVILLTQFYEPEPVYKGQVFAEAIQELGYDVEVVTGFPNYPGGEIYDGYRIRVLDRTVVNGVTVTRVPIYPSHSDSRIGRIVNYASFSLSAFAYLVWNARRASLIYAYLPPLTVGLAAAASRFFHGCPVVLDIHDLWPDTLPATGMVSNKTVLRLIDLAAQWTYRRAQFIILHTHGFRAKLLERGVPAHKMQTIIGWTNEYVMDHDFSPSGDGFNQMKSRPGLKILYAGNIGLAQALGSILDAAELIQSEGSGNLVSFCFLGDGIGKRALEEEARQRDIRNVHFLPRVSPNEVIHYLSASDVLLVHLRADPLFEITLPSKTQAYMYAGKPILMAASGEAATIVRSAEAGIVATPQDPQSIKEAAMEFSRMTEVERIAMGQRGHSYYLRELSMNRGIRSFSRIFREISQR